MEPIKQISCGADHTLAIGAAGVWAWGCGSSYKLGMGDVNDRYDPCLVPRLRGKFVSQVAAGTWHSLALVYYPPMLGGGWVYSWGSGYHGQLGHGTEMIVKTPETLKYFRSVHMLIKYISTGSHHCAVISREGELYTWGSNNNGALGRYDMM